MTGLSKHILLLLAVTAIVQGQKGAPAGYCKADTDCFCTICPGGKSATCQAAGMGQGSGNCQCPDSQRGTLKDDPSCQPPPKTTSTTSTQPTTTAPSLPPYSAPTVTLQGPTTFCQGLSPGGGSSCLTIAEGCFATSPLYNYVPATTLATSRSSTIKSGPSTLTDSDTSSQATASSTISIPVSTQTSSPSVSTTQLVASTSSSSAKPRSVSLPSVVSSTASSTLSGVPSSSRLTSSTAPLTISRSQSSSLTSVTASSGSLTLSEAPHSSPSSLSAVSSTTASGLSSSQSSRPVPSGLTTSAETTQPSTTAPFGVTISSSGTTLSEVSRTPASNSNGPPTSASTKPTPITIPTPVTIPTSLSQPIASVTSQVARASSAASALTANANTNTANVAKTAIDDALAGAEHLKDLAEDAAIIALLTQLIGPLKAAQAAAIAAVATPSAETAAAVAVALSAAAAAEAALEASAAAGPSTCSLEKRSTGHERRMLEARQNGFCFKWDGSVPNPANLAEIPAIQNCVGTSGSNSYTQAAVNTALKEGVRYLFGQQVAGSNKYPHTYKNLDAGVHTDPACAGLDIQEFPILSDGSPVARGPGAKSTALFPGSERVLFALGNGVAFYCGLITHVGPQAGGPPPGNLVPFRNCTP